MYPLLPLSDTILLTQMPTIEHELAASSAAVTATLSLYLLAAAVGFALWGPIAGGCALVCGTVLGYQLAGRLCTDSTCTLPTWPAADRCAACVPYSPHSSGLVFFGHCTTGVLVVTADLLGRVFVFHAALLLFTGSSVGCALAPNIALFLVGR